MTPRFEKIFEWLIPWEGRVYENDPDDPGGATKFGIDKRSHPNEDIRNLTEARAKEIYWNEYWERYHCETYPFPMGETVFNCCVNAGWGRVQKIMSVIGPTGSAEAFLNEQDNFYRRLAKARPRSAKFLKGWLNRTASLRKFLEIS